ncbi:GGDEF domain-containing protein [Vibrio renipiscarius]|uniref:GGDEF domain-containing protein n=1 Tax=Vibrio renipiscarius TaxID=1461322 RepID=UPI00354BCEA2
MFNSFQINRLSKSIINDFNQIYSLSRRFAQYYNNTTSITLEKGIYEKNSVDIMVIRRGEVKILSHGISKLRTELAPMVQDNIWTIAIFENPAHYSHFSPLRAEYKKRYHSYKPNDVIQRIVKLEGLENTFDQFYSCNIKLSEPYIEEGTDQLIRTVYYPIYNNRMLDALLAIDIREHFIHQMINAFNKDHWTVATTQHGWAAYQHQVVIPCSDAEPITIGFRFLDIFKLTLIPSLFISLFAYLSMIVFKKRQVHIKRDKMTGFYRRDFYEPRLKKVSNFSMLIIDIDFFKMINDNYGHKVGDEVITEITRRIASQIRSDDIAIRWGGEEFVVLFKEMNDEMLHTKAERIREHVAHKPIANIDVTISVGGVALYNDEFCEAYKLADHALYQSKREGRNRVTIHNKHQNTRDCTT